MRLKICVIALPESNTYFAVAYVACIIKNHLRRTWLPSLHIHVFMYVVFIIFVNNYRHKHTFTHIDHWRLLWWFWILWINRVRTLCVALDVSVWVRASICDTCCPIYIQSTHNKFIYTYKYVIIKKEVRFQLSLFAALLAARATYTLPACLVLRSIPGILIVEFNGLQYRCDRSYIYVVV